MTDSAGPDSSDRGRAIDPDGSYRQARDVALRALSVRDRTHSELAALLARRGTAGPVIDQVLTRLADLGLVDDLRFATTWVESRQRTRHLAASALAAELRRRGVPAEIAEQALATINPDDTEQAALTLARSRIARCRSLAPAVVTRRVAAQLARRGYGSEVCLRVVRAALAEADLGERGTPADSG